MIKHIFKMVWNRKRASALVALEIAISFLVLFAAVSLGAYGWLNYSRPLGFSYTNIWNMSIDRKITTDDEWTPEMVELTRQILLATRDLPEVDGVAAVLSPPFSFGSSNSAYEIQGRLVRFERNEVTDDFKSVMKLSLVRGRWFSRDEDGPAKITPVVINQHFARTVFGSEDPIGKSLTSSSDAVQQRVIGVITDFRKDGEYSGPGNYAFFRANLDDPKTRPPANLAIHVRPGTTRDFEERLVKKLQAVAPTYSFEAKPLAEMRESTLRLRRAPILVASFIAAFLMIMVGLGLTGVLWQNVTQRTKEIGLRRAKGATETDIHFQILGELIVITSVGVALGLLVAVQFPLLNLVGSVSAGVYVASFAISLLLIFALTTLCGLYPSHLASRVQPAEALHYE